MVQVRDDYPLDDDGQVDLLRWVERLPRLDEHDIAQDELIKAGQLAMSAENKVEEGVDYWGEGYSRFLTGLEMAEILTELNLDQDTLVAAILYRTVRDGVHSLSQIEQDFGAVVAQLIDGVLQMANISNSDVIGAGKVLGQKQEQSDHVRKMLVAMVDDVRVALIKLAERTCAIRAVKNNPQRRYKVAKEVFEIYSPLAHRLGIAHIKWELEDLSFRYMEPDAYKRIAKQLDERRLDRQQFINGMTSLLEQELVDVNIEGQVSGRAKHIYSIWRKMQRKKIDFSEVYDIRAVRILVREVRDCYTVLGIVHTLWKAIPNEFDDYIALPKENGYRSLHTAIIGPNANIVEIQIRTFDMHEEAEFGVCAHWQYKGADGASSNGYEEKIAWLKQVIDEHDDYDNIGDIADELTHDITQDQIYVFTPEGHVIELSQGATPLDFAYRVHTEIGHRCRGAKVNGRIVPLTYQLENGQQIEVLTTKEAEPSREWLRPTLGYLKTTRARAKVRHWFKLRDKAQNIITGRNLLEREFKRLALTSLDYKAVASDIGFTAVEDMYAAVGSGERGTGQILRSAQKITDNGVENQFELIPKHKSAVNASNHRPGEIQIYGTGNMLTQIAACCKPVPGDVIGGYVTIGRGVSIHRLDCVQFLHLQEKEAERIIEVNWGHKPESTYPVDIQIQAYDRSGLLRDITALLANEKVNVIAINTLSNQADSTADMQVTIEVKGIEWLSRILAKIDQLPNVTSVRRVTAGRH